MNYWESVKIVKGLVYRQETTSLCEWQALWMDQGPIRCPTGQCAGPGPVLFLLFINNLDTVASENRWLVKFVDDTKLLRSSTATGMWRNCRARWTSCVTGPENGGMEFNVAKCHVMHVGKRNIIQTYNMDGKALTRTEQERDIGVVMSDNLKPTVQCKKAAQTINAVLGQILRAFHYRDRYVFLDLYKQYVRPHMEFAVAAWSP